MPCVIGSDQETMYQRYLQKQTAELEQLQQERQRLLEVQQELARMSQRSEAHKTVSTQVWTLCNADSSYPYTNTMYVYEQQNLNLGSWDKLICSKRFRENVCKLQLPIVSHMQPLFQSWARGRLYAPLPPSLHKSDVLNSSAKDEFEEGCRKISWGGTPASMW